eukprot:Phypoly_transcript_12143.p1 GENE.Phypoly_transcript_12143~~Phypoly_transcript_12143.p1  ORF type:complete len:350 (+),score=90.74 Phypoly_transcript_12143:65-1114(+)
MEHSQQYINAVALSERLKQQIDECDQTLTTWEKARTETISEIEEHFAQCVSILAARKAALLADLDDKLTVQKTKFEEAKVALQISLDGCNELLRSGQSLFSTSQDIAETVWQQTAKLPSHSIPKEISVSFTTTLSKEIHNHGEVREGKNEEAYQEEANQGEFMDSDEQVGNEGKLAPKSACSPFATTVSFLPNSIFATSNSGSPAPTTPNSSFATSNSGSPAPTTPNSIFATSNSGSPVPTTPNSTFATSNSGSTAPIAIFGIPISGSPAPTTPNSTLGTTTIPFGTTTLAFGTTNSPSSTSNTTFGSNTIFGANTTFGTSKSTPFGNSIFGTSLKPTTPSWAEGTDND